MYEGRYLEKHFERIHRIIADRIYDIRSISDEEILAWIDEIIGDIEREDYLPLRQKLDLRKDVFASFRKLDILQELIEDGEISEIMVNGTKDIFVEKNGMMMKLPKEFKSDARLEDLIQQIVSRINRTINTSSPIADARLEDGSRVHIVLPPVSLTGPVITIRKFPEVITMERLIGWGAITREAAEFLKKLVRSGYNIFISGGTNSGKTTFLNALSAFIPADERVITIEDAAELQLIHIHNLVRLEARAANARGEGSITIGDLIKASLRMNPDRIVVGEVRAGEALDMLQAMNTGHDGSLSTGHGNSPRDMLSRLETMVLGAAPLPLAAIRGQIASAIDIIVHLGRLRDRSRKVLHIAEIADLEETKIRLHSLYVFQEEKDEGQFQVKGALQKVGELQNTDKIKAAGERL